MASIFNALGLTFRDVGFVKFNAWFPPLLGMAHYGLTFWCKSSLSVSAVEMLPVSADKVPFFVAAVMPLVAVMCAIVAIMGITIYGKKGCA